MKLITKNKYAYHDYSIEKEYEAWIVLKGHEVKSVKQSHINIKDAVARIDGWELWIYNVDIPLYEKTSHALVPWYEPKGKRKLLVTKKELAKISAASDKSGMIVLPLEVFLDKHWRIKIKIGVWKLLRKVEKKQILKERDIKKQMDREIKWL